ncbi:hypothetical protein FA15DRAFT_580398 [Coprinopsis marcescibilis]|uniref:F-box domain-containing protein n=1 Tax=Coprinopsis marcescibilis TaxID=230819 RepID=A0A5C3LE08_COPMA|nr:hypothetical protein FA15DRAFT_580398 [Coprinopsis marcescibilis]
MGVVGTAPPAPSTVIQQQSQPPGLGSPGRTTVELIQPQKLGPKQVKHYIDMADKRTRQILDEWTVRDLNEAQYAECLQDTRRLIQIIKRLEFEQTRTVPLLNPKVEVGLFMARLDYRVKFGRIFRINDLPIEIICNIFHLVSWSWTEPLTGHRNRANLTYVCRSWRKIALEDATLWSVIWFKYTGDEKDLLRATTWFERCGDAPKDVRISEADPAKPIPLAILDNILRLICRKWASVRIFVVVLQGWDEALAVLNKMRSFSRIEGPVILQRFELHRTGNPFIQLGSGYEPNGHREPIPAFGGALLPSLKHFSLAGVHVDWTNSKLSNLTILDLRRMSLEKAPTFTQFRAILHGSPKLQKLILDGAGPNFEGRISDAPPIFLPQLVTLVLVDFSAEYGTFVLSQLLAPNVRDLTLMNLLGADYTPFYHALTGAFPQVRILTLYNSEVYPNRPDIYGVVRADDRLRSIIIKWLLSMPHVTYLRLGHVRQTLLDMFIYPIPAASPDEAPLPCVYPKLSILEWQNMEPTIIVAWLKTRKDLGAPIKRLYIGEHTATKIKQDMHPALAELESEVFLLRTGHKAPEETALQSL